MTEKERKIHDFIQSNLEQLYALPESTCRAKLAELRRGVGHIPGDIPALWGIFLEGMPEDLYGDSGEPSPAEWAVYIALTMFALSQQGPDYKSKWMHVEKIRFGSAVRELASVKKSQEDEDKEFNRIRNRFNKLATASDIQELAMHLRGMVNLLRENNIKMDYASLAVDLYRYNLPETRAKVRLKWGQDFYRTSKDNETES